MEVLAAVALSVFILVILAGAFALLVLIQDLRQTLQEIRRILQDLERDLPEISRNLKEATQKSNALLDDLHTSLKGLRGGLEALRHVVEWIPTTSTRGKPLWITLGGTALYKLWQTARRKKKGGSES